MLPGFFISTLYTRMTFATPIIPEANDLIVQGDFYQNVLTFDGTAVSLTLINTSNYPILVQFNNLGSATWTLEANASIGFGLNEVQLTEIAFATNVSQQGTGPGSGSGSSPTATITYICGVVK